MARNTHLTPRDLRNTVLFAAAVYLAIRFIAQAVDVLLVFSIIALLVVTLNPLVTWLARHRVPRGLSAVLMGLVVLGALVLVAYLIIPPLESQFAQFGKRVPTLLTRTQEWANDLAVRYPRLAALIPQQEAITAGTLRQILQSSLGGVTRIGTSAITVVAMAILIFISTIYSLTNPTPITRGFLRLFRPNYRARVERAAEQLGRQIRGWAFGNLFAMFSIFALTWGAMALVGLEQAFMFGVIAGFLEAVPIIGPILSAVLPVLAALVQKPILAVWVILAFVGIQQFESHILVPMVMSRQVSLHPVTVIFWVLVMGGLFGIVGIFLAVPAAVTFGVVFEDFVMCHYERTCEDPQTKRERFRRRVTDEDEQAEQ